MLTSRKADANMWWIIIGAVIALVVLIVLLFMFTGKSGALEGGLLDCQSKGGECTQKVTDNNGDCVSTCRNNQRSYSSIFSCPTLISDDYCCCLGATVPADSNSQ